MSCTWGGTTRFLNQYMLGAIQLQRSCKVHQVEHELAMHLYYYEG